MKKFEVVHSWLGKTKFVFNTVIGKRKYIRVDGNTAVLKCLHGENVLVVVLNSKYLSQGVYQFNKLTFGEAEDLTAESLENGGIMFYIVS